ncbi:MAG TPA: hypothetical protein VFN02_07190 [Ktedonobacteraceae bacterium]|nr:hypothetical protein [Ktedonobacteraceae bacterium]
MRIREAQQSDAAAMARVIVDNYRSAHRFRRPIAIILSSPVFSWYIYQDE